MKNRNKKIATKAGSCKCAKAKSTKKSATMAFRSMNTNDKAAFISGRNVPKTEVSSDPHINHNTDPIQYDDKDIDKAIEMADLFMNMRAPSVIDGEDSDPRSSKAVRIMGNLVDVQHMVAIITVAVRAACQEVSSKHHEDSGIIEAYKDGLYGVVDLGNKLVAKLRERSFKRIKSLSNKNDVPTPIKYVLQTVKTVIKSGTYKNSGRNKKRAIGKLSSTEAYDLM